MSVDRRKFLVASGATLSSLPFLKGSTLARAIDPLIVQTGAKRMRKVIYDQDHRGPLSTDTVGTLMLLQAENVEILGITTVTGDQWAKQETAYALRLLELMGRTDIPVFMGAREPLLNTKAEAQKRYEMF